MKKLLCVLLLIGSYAIVHAQDEPWRNRVFADEIASVQFLSKGKMPAQLPILRLSSEDSLYLQFDLMSDGFRDYEYTIEHFNHDWTPSSLGQDEYIFGFREARVQNMWPSEQTMTEYIVYEIALPNSDMRPLVSGNYKIKVIDVTDDEPRVVISQRFFVAEQSKWGVQADFVRPSKVSKDETHHEIDFVIDTRDANLFSPLTDLKTYVLQNGRFDQMIGPLRPFSSRGNKHVYDYQDSVIFSAGMESRVFDIRNLEFRSQNVEALRRQNFDFEVSLRADRDRRYRGYLEYIDFNGGFVLANTAINQNYFQSEYTRVLFRLEKAQEIEDADVYVVGGFNDYLISEKYRMQYSATGQAYFVELPFKQGYYNYEYEVVPRGQDKPDPELSVEGNSFQARNAYQFLVYFKGPADRFDRLMCVQTIEN